MPPARPPQALLRSEAKVRPHVATGSPTLAPYMQLKLTCSNSRPCKGILRVCCRSGCRPRTWGSGAAGAGILAAVECTNTTTLCVPCRCGAAPPPPTTSRGGCTRMCCGRSWRAVRQRRRRAASWTWSPTCARGSGRPGSYGKLREAAGSCATGSLHCLAPHGTART